MTVDQGKMRDVERAARAMCVADGFDPDGLIAYAKSGRREAIDEWDSYLRRSRAAIAAMNTDTRGGE